MMQLHDTDVTTFENVTLEACTIVMKSRCPSAKVTL